MTILLETVRQFYEAGYTLHGWCPKCQKGVPVSLRRLVEKGVGEKTVKELRLRHACGARVSVVLAPPTGYDEPK